MALDEQRQIDDVHELDTLYTAGQCREPRALRGDLVETSSVRVERQTV